MPWFRIVATVAAMEPSLFMPPRIKISAISRRPIAEMAETSALSVFIAYHFAIVRLCDYQHLRPQVQGCWKRKRDLRNCKADVRYRSGRYDRCLLPAAARQKKPLAHRALQFIVRKVVELAGTANLVMRLPDSTPFSFSAETAADS